VIKKGSKSPDLYTWSSGLKIFTSHVVYSRIWRNLPMYDRHFFYIFLWMKPIWLPKQFVKRKLEGRKLSDLFTGEVSPETQI
jgi:hypothetical protein